MEKWLLIIIGLLMVSSVDAATYYVSTSGADSNPGTTQQPLRTIQKGIDIAKAGDTVLVLEGNYGEDVYLVNAGTSANIITIQAQGTVNTKRFWVSEPYVKIDGFRLSGKISDYSSYIEITPTGSHVWISNNYIDASASTSAYGIRHNAKTASFSTITHNEIVNTESPAFDMGGTDHLIENNIIHEFSNDVFRSEGCIRCTFRGNLAYNGYEIGYHTDCIQTFGHNNHDSYDVLYENNICRDADAQVMMLEGWGGPDIRDYTFRNNIWANLLEHGQIAVKNTQFYNNIFYNVEKNGNNYALRFDTSCYGGEAVVNNLFVDCGDGAIGSYDSGGCPGFFDYNYVARGAGNNWDGSVDTPTETHQVLGSAGNIPFTNYASNDFTPRSGSLGVNAGTKITSFSVDILGNNRPYGAAWDIGPYEYGGQSCVPSCSGKSCGDNGCGGSCGTCQSGYSCNSLGQCVATCSSSCVGKSCGDNGCGGSCGTCQSGYSCNSLGQCVATCSPSWQCTIWSSCQSNQQVRTCTDTNNCGTSTGKPSESQTCGISKIEAESGTITSPFQTVSDSIVSGSKYIQAVTESGSAIYTFSIDKAGEYKMIGRVYAEDDSTDSFYFSIDNAPNDIWDLNPHALASEFGVWRDDELTKRGSGGFDSPQYDPYSFNLASGSHSLTLRGREGGAKLDYLYFLLVSTCSHDSDSNCDGMISQDELLQYIIRWKSGQVTMPGIIEAIKRWRIGY